MIQDYLSFASVPVYHYNDVIVGVSNHQPHDCLLKRLFRRRSKKASKLRVTGLSEGNSPVTGEFPTQRASNAENVSIWWRHHALCVMDKSTQHRRYIHRFIDKLCSFLYYLHIVEREHDTSMASFVYTPHIHTTQVTKKNFN